MASPHSVSHRPRIFLDASAAGHGVAELFRNGLSGGADVTTSRDGITDASRTFDLAAFVLGSGSDAGALVRLGVFLGSLGRERVVILCSPALAREIPSELNAATLVPYPPHDGGHSIEALDAACTSVLEHARRLASPTGWAPATEPSPSGPAGHVARRLRRSLGTACSLRSGQTLRISDISLSGALLETYGELPENQLLDLDLTLDTGSRVRVTARVARIQYPQWGRVGGAGVEFVRFEGDSYAVLERYFDAVSA